MRITKSRLKQLIKEELHKIKEEEKCSKSEETLLEEELERIYETPIDMPEDDGEELEENKSNKE